jgi:hypothetical protein
MTVPPKMDLTCVVRRHVKVLSRRKCNFSDAVFNPSQFVDIFPDPQLTSLFTIARSKEIGVQCQACDVSALNVSQYIEFKFVNIALIQNVLENLDQYGLSYDRGPRSFPQGRWMASRCQPARSRSNGSLPQKDREG